MRQLDDFFKKKLDEQELPFNEAHWLAAQDLIDGQQQKRRSIWWWRMGCLTVAIGVVIFLLIPNWSAEDAFVAKQEQPAEKDSVQSSLDTKATPPSSTEALPEASLPSQANRQTEQPASANESAASTAATSAPCTATQLSIPPAQVPSPKGVEPAAQVSTTSPPIAATSKEQATSRPSAAAETLPAETDSTTRQVAEALLPIPTLAFELAEKESEFPTEAAAVSLSQGRWKLSTLLGGTLSPSEPQVDPVLGLRLERTLGEQLGIYAETVYRSQAFRRMTPASSVQEQYGFGLRQEAYALEASSLHYVDLNMGLTYHYLRQHYHLGAGASYLLGARGALNQNITVETTRFPSGPSTIEEGWVAKDGLRDWAFRLQGGYEYYLLPTLSLGMQLQYRLNPVMEADSKVSGPFSVDFMIKYSLW